VIGIIVYRMSVLSALYLQEEELLYKNAGIVSSCTAACINLVAIFILNFVRIFITTLCKYVLKLSAGLW
jgi:anoctamin-1